MNFVLFSKSLANQITYPSKSSLSFLIFKSIASKDSWIFALKLSICTIVDFSFSRRDFRAPLCGFISSSLSYSKLMLSSKINFCCFKWAMFCERSSRFCSYRCIAVIAVIAFIRSGSFASSVIYYY